MDDMNPGMAMSPIRRRLLAVALLAIAPMAAAQTATRREQQHPDVVDVRVRANGLARFDFDVTISSPYDTPERYADAFRVLGPDGRVLGERSLFHDHADEQPFTRDLRGVSIPAGIRVVKVQGRDRRYGYGGRALDVALPSR